MTAQTIKLTASDAVAAALKRAMPKTNKAQLALAKYISVLEQHLEQSLLHMDDNMYRFFRHFYVSTHDLTLQAPVSRFFHGSAAPAPARLFRGERGCGCARRAVSDSG